MKITIVSLNFPPQIGGLENIMFGLANQWHNQGHHVTVFTVTPGPDNYGFTVIRTLNLVQLLRSVRKSDVFFEANISLKTCLIGWLNRKKWFVTQQLTYTHVQRWQEYLKNVFTIAAKNISASRYIAETLRGKSLVIPNFYAPSFKRLPDVPKVKEVIFVGRLVSDKGADDLIQALALVQQKGISFRCTIVGNGPEEKSLKNMVVEKGLEKQVTLVGPLRGEALVHAMNEHAIMVIPSKWPEPFGIVALEGLACGCRIVCSRDGGLPEAANGFGWMYPNNNVAELAVCLEKALQAGPLTAEEQEPIANYLLQRTEQAVAAQYMEVFMKTTAKNNLI